MVSCLGCGSSNIIYVNSIVFSKPAFSGEFMLKAKEKVAEMYKCNECGNTFILEGEE
jgi:hypothetical protein